MTVGRLRRELSADEFMRWGIWFALRNEEMKMAQASRR